MHELINNESMAVFIGRCFLGLLFFLQGADAVFGIGVRNVVQAIEGPLVSKRIPRALIILGAYYTSYIELVGGALLIAGLFKSYVLYLLGLDLLMASLAFSLIKPMWDMQFVFPRLILLLFLLLAPPAWDLLSLDHLLSTLKNN
ncbi:MAG: DoxX family membrane protein [Bacteroidota bacterium]